MSSRQWDLLGGPLALGEMKRRVQVRADMLRAAVVVGRVPEAARGSAFRDFFEVKGLGGRPVVSLRAERDRSESTSFFLIERRGPGNAIISAERSSRLA